MEFNLAEVHEAIAAAIPDRECLVFRDRRLTYADVTDRSRRLANHLRGRGLGLHRERSELAGWESGQDHVALYLHNGNEYPEAMLGAYKARVAHFNVNYRYVEEELFYLLRDSGARGAIYHAAFAPTLAKILPELRDLDVLLQVADESGNDLLPGAVDYEEALAHSSAERPDLEWSPDDLYVLYTGGTTGMPKGVLWRQADIFVAAKGGRNDSGQEFASLDEIVERARRGRVRAVAAPPFMHGAAQWAAFHNWTSGNTVIVPNEPHLDADDLLGTIERERANAILIVGDAFARPLIEQLDRGSYDLASWRVLISGGAILSASLKAELLERVPGLLIVDSIGSSESGGQGQHVSRKGEGVSTGSFEPGPDSTVVSEDLTRVLAPGDPELGWFAKAGRVPLGYLGDEEKTRRTFPEIEGVRYSVPGDRARFRSAEDGGGIEVLGRDSVTINSGGEKIFAEEVEHALKHDPAVWDTVVVGRPSERWGQEVVAIVKLRDGVWVDEDALRATCAEHIARYKLPKAFLFTDEIVRSPSGKADYRWAKAQVTGEDAS